MTGARDAAAGGAPRRDAAERIVRWVVEDGAGDRLDVHIARRLPELSRSRAAQLVVDGWVRVNGRPARKSQRPEPGDVVEVVVPEPEPATAVPEPIALDIVYQDADLLVVNKPAGLVVHPAPGHPGGTLVNALLHHVPDLSGIGGVLRPGIVHRLDRDTSGLLLVAKNDAAHRRLAEALRRREIVRRYLAAAWGHLAGDAITVTAPIGRAPTERKRMAVVEGGRDAVTHFRRLERWRAADFLEARLETGRTHQIRVHLAHIGHPVVGDATYAPRGERRISGEARAWAAAFARRVPRQFLHAAWLEFDHPTTGERMRFSAPLPPELEAAATWARDTS